MVAVREGVLQRRAGHFCIPFFPKYCEYWLRDHTTNQQPLQMFYGVVLGKTCCLMISPEIQDINCVDENGKYHSAFPSHIATCCVSATCTRLSGCPRATWCPFGDGSRQKRIVRSGFGLLIASFIFFLYQNWRLLQPIFWLLYTDQIVGLTDRSCVALASDCKIDRHGFIVAYKPFFYMIVPLIIFPGHGSSDNRCFLCGRLQ